MSYNESLSPNSNYPHMSQSEWDNAPWNEPVIPEQDFEVDVEYVLQKKAVKVTTDDYSPEFDEETGHVDANTEDTDWENAYENSHYTIPELLSELESYIKQDLERYKGSATKERQLKEMLEDCQGWEMYDKSYCEAE
jgi:hypothetical protein